MKFSPSAITALTSIIVVAMFLTVLNVYYLCYNKFSWVLIASYFPILLATTIILCAEHQSNKRLERRQ